MKAITAALLVASTGVCATGALAELAKYPGNPPKVTPLPTPSGPLKADPRKIDPSLLNGAAGLLVRPSGGGWAKSASGLSGPVEFAVTKNKDPLYNNGPASIESSADPSFKVILGTTTVAPDTFGIFKLTLPNTALGLSAGTSAKTYYLRAKFAGKVSTSVKISLREIIQ